MTLSDRIARLEATSDHRIERDLTEIDRQLSRAEGKLVNASDKSNSWTRPVELTLELEAA